MYRQSEAEVRILILAPTGRDAGLLADTLFSDGIQSAVCLDGAELILALQEGAATAIIAEEALSSDTLNKLVRWLQSQPAWSDIPLLVLTSSGRPNLSTVKKARELEALGNVTFLERPARPYTLRSSIRAALRARLRQYEMRSRQEALTRLNTDLEQFAYSASHDLQEPLRNIAIYSQLLSNRYGEVLDTQGKEFLGLIRSGALQMEALLTDLLAYTQAANIPDEPVSPVDSTQVLLKALCNLAEAVRTSNAAVTHTQLPAIRMREVHLHQLFQNLIGNAIKYRRDESAKVHVSARRQDGYWLFSVEDDGIGIDQEFKERIFGIFKRLHTREKYAGTGMGLAICQRIAERYGGRIWVESELGKGSTFFFTVPQ